MDPDSPMAADPASRRPARAVDLLVVGGLTVDTFPDGSTAAGGAALHATRAAAELGLRVGVVTRAGDEPEARRGLEALRRIATVHVEAARSTIAFAHGESAEGRTLVLGTRGSELTVPVPAADGADAVLYAPVAGELRAEHLDVPQGILTGAVLQGWLRSLDPGRPARPLPLAALGEPLVARLAGFDMVCASMEDLSAEAGHDPRTLLSAMRRVLGGRPLVVITDGPRGAWVDERATVRQIVPPRVVSGVDTTGAGDAFAALMLATLASGEGPFRAAEIAADETARFLRRRRMRRVAIGDVHGHRARLVRLLFEAGLTDSDGRWAAGDAELWFLGDLADRGPDGIGVIELVRALQEEARIVAGRVESLLGNHELLLLAAYLLPGPGPRSGQAAFLRADWLANGGRPEDLARMTPDIADWLRARPAMAQVEDDLLVHADSLVYAALGASVAEVNAVVHDILATHEPQGWAGLLGGLSDRMAFSDAAALDAVLRHFGAARVVHGHTPVPILVDADPDLSVRPRRYASGRAIAADPGLYLGGPGFVVEL